jgi:hypothetical protein
MEKRARTRDEQVELACRMQRVRKLTAQLKTPQPSPGTIAAVETLFSGPCQDLEDRRGRVLATYRDETLYAGARPRAAETRADAGSAHARAPIRRRLWLDSD